MTQQLRSLTAASEDWSPVLNPHAGWPSRSIYILALDHKVLTTNKVCSLTLAPGREADGYKGRCFFLSFFPLYCSEDGPEFVFLSHDNMTTTD